MSNGLKHHLLEQFRYNVEMLISIIDLNRYHYYTWNYVGNSGKIIRNPNFDYNFKTGMDRLNKMKDKLDDLCEDDVQYSEEDENYLKEQFDLGIGTLNTLHEITEISFEEFMKKNIKKD